jgi:hypothetical protein
MVFLVFFFFFFFFNMREDIIFLVFDIYRLSHLFFADNNLLFCKVNIPEWIQIREVLDIYECASSKKIEQ